jgi:hypothetical protein
MEVNEHQVGCCRWFVVYSATFTNFVFYIMGEESGVVVENHRPVASHWQNVSHNVLSSTPGHELSSNSQLYW